MKILRQIVSTEEDAYDKKLSQIYKIEAKRWGRMIHMEIYTYILHILQNSFFSDKRQREFIAKSKKN